MDIELLKELSNKTLKGYRKKAKKDEHRWISRGLAKTKMGGKPHPDASRETRSRVKSTEINDRIRKKAAKKLSKTISNYRRDD